MIVGTRVKRSGHSLESKRLYYLGLGDYTRKQAAREAYETAREERGTITAVKPPSGGFNCATCDTYDVQWDDGSKCSTMPYMIEPA